MKTSAPATRTALMRLSSGISGPIAVSPVPLGQLGFSAISCPQPGGTGRSDRLPWLQAVRARTVERHSTGTPGDHMQAAIAEARVRSTRPPLPTPPRSPGAPALTEARRIPGSQGS